MNDESDHAADKKRQDFDKAWPQLYKDLYPYVLNLTHNAADAEDITQNSLLSYRDHQDRHGWEVVIEDEGAYLRRTAHNQYVDWLKDHPKETVITDDEENRKIQHEISIDSIAIIENRIYIDELCESLAWNVLLRGLSKDDVSLFYQNVVDGMSCVEIAKETGKNIYKVRYDLNRIKATIRARAKKLIKEKGNNLFGKGN